MSRHPSLNSRGALYQGSVDSFGGQVEHKGGLSDLGSTNKDHEYYLISTK